MLYLLLQRSVKAAVISTAALSAISLAAFPSYAQDLGTFSSGPFRTVSNRPSYDFDRALSLQSLGPDVICGSNLGRTPYRTSRRFSLGQSAYRPNTLTNNPLIPNRLDPQRISTQHINSLLVSPTLTNDPLIPNRLDQTAGARLSQTSSRSDQSVNCQTIQNSSVTTINQPLSNHSLSVTINSGGNSGGAPLARNVNSSRLDSGGNLPLSAVANLPDGNYRVTSATGVRNDISTAELSNRGGRLFTFNKSGSTITGSLNDFDGGFNACVTGSVEGNIVTGQAWTNDVGANVLGRNYLDLGLALELGDRVASDRYNNSVLNLGGFSRISAGAAVPPTRC